ncbi:MAG TPA: hypothetical protein VGB54_11160 [Allosphingosinicella sp.]
MRAIAAREHRVALAQRREARSAHAAAGATTSSTASWSTRPDRRRKAGELDRLQVAAAEAAKERWARRHPEAAASERRIRKDRAQMLERWGHKRDGTPETHEHASRRNQGALARLWKNGEIDSEQLHAAVEIAAVAERIGADVAVKTASLETRVDATRMGDGTFHERLGQVRREMAYTRWRAEVRGPIAAVLDMIVGEPEGFTIVAKRYRMHNRKAKRLLIDALDLWPRILGGVCKEVDDATLAAAHAGIL